MADVDVVQISPSNCVVLNACSRSLIVVQPQDGSVSAASLVGAHEA